MPSTPSSKIRAALSPPRKRWCRSRSPKIGADSVRHLSQNTQFLAPSDDGGVHPTRILNVNTVETYDLYENRFIYHLIQRLLTFVDKRTDVIFWSTGNEIATALRCTARSTMRTRRSSTTSR